MNRRDRKDKRGNASLLAALKMHLFIFLYFSKVEVVCRNSVAFIVALLF